MNLRDRLSALMAAASDVKDQAKTDPAATPALIERIAIAEKQISTAIGEINPRAPARFSNHQQAENAA
ncbi:hypothetical protein [Hyphococcus sp.]|uniref:hypothetical protein n=1 Tax=Hyphococcus sp. TaxID=2038636 RepID=UPI002080658F|nr:MAG: hypothetical protein DHS20C04_32350 [Marinicaulis sp.]